MTLTRGRVLRGAEGLEPIPAPSRSPAPRGRIAPRELVDAELRAKAIVAAAEAHASEILARAEASVADVRLRAETEGRAQGLAEVAAHALRLSTLEARADERALDRIVQIATVLAERLLGEALALDPARVRALARQAISEARGARAVTVLAHPEDAALLAADVALLGDPSAIAIQPDAALARGHLVLHTEIGVLDADLGPQLGRLSLRLRESLTP